MNGSTDTNQCKILSVKIERKAIK